MEQSIRGQNSPVMETANPLIDSKLRGVEFLKTFVGKPYQDFDACGNYLGCFEPLYHLYGDLPKYALPKAKEGYFAEGFARILENFEKVDTPEILDMIVFRFGRDILHVGIFIGGGKFFHVQRGSAFEIRRLFHYENKILGYFKAKSHLARKY